MNAIIGMTEVAKSAPELPEKAADCLGKIEISSRYLLSLINDILDMSRIESGKMQLAETDFDLDQQLLEIETVIRTQAEAKKTEFSAGKRPAASLGGWGWNAPEPGSGEPAQQCRQVYTGRRKGSSCGAAGNPSSKMQSLFLRQR